MVFSVVLEPLSDILPSSGSDYYHALSGVCEDLYVVASLLPHGDLSDGMSLSAVRSGG